MITYMTGDLFASTADVLVDPVNCRGGIGYLAADFVRRFAGLEAFYRQSCGRTLIIGRTVLYRESEPMILLFPTKDHWRRPAQLDYIDAGLTSLARVLAHEGVSSVALPKLGSGAGGLLWESVKPVVERHLRALDWLMCFVYE
jgi:O-acetyl-ADP-ribose deacetylase (regulator of RNase III)